MERHYRAELESGQCLTGPHKDDFSVDLNGIDETICKYLVICEGNSPTQVSALYDSVREFARKEAGQKPVTVDGLRNCLWIAMDYTDVIVHIFLPETREFYDIDHLWEDAKFTDIPDFE